ncbi:DUF4276 family protein [Shewanella sp. UCD-KL12]|uniref:DUF4276 family protein n=1 Tax=Shewanella sp. UCD-KL12 TaxID=1917163 RepID=UPI0009708688|nr:DUF4276 family protein [Shewanella sp. UCD-KL12]
MKKIPSELKMDHLARSLVDAVMNNSTTIIVEGSTDVKIVKNIITLAGYDQSKVNIFVLMGKLNLLKVLDSEEIRHNDNVIVLLDLDVGSIYESKFIARTKSKINNSKIPVCTATPSIESWLFADDINLKTLIKETDKAEAIYDRLPMPEDITYPKQVLRNLLGSKYNIDMIMSGMDINLSASRSSSLRNFLKELSIKLGEPKVEWEESYVRSAGRDVFSKLVNEIIDPNKVIYKSLDGNKITAREMSLHIRDGSDIGVRYSVEVLRMARDLLARENSK